MCWRKRAPLWIQSAESVPTAGVDNVAFPGPAVGGLLRMRAPGLHLRMLVTFPFRGNGEFMFLFFLPSKMTFIRYG